MAEDFICGIYSKSELIYIYRQCAELLTIRDLSKFSKLWSAYSAKILAVVEEIRQSDDSLANRLEGMAYAVIGNISDPLLALELIEGGIIPILYQYIDKYRGIDVTEGEWTLKSSRSGYLTLYNNKLACHIHALDNPMWEARNEAKVLYDGSYDRVLMFGAGLGYLAKALWELSEGSLDIYIFERDECIEEYAHMYGVVDSISEDRIHYIVNKDMVELFSDYLSMQIGEYKNLIIVQDWMAECIEEPIRSDIKNQIMSDRALMSFKACYNVNFWRNKKRFSGEISELFGKHKGKDFIVVAAGPSLDDNIHYIKENIGSKIVVCVNTVLKRMLNEGIKPDYVCLIDPTVGVFPHVDGIEEKTKDIPLIAESVAFWKFLNVYKGPIYRVFGANYSFSIEEAKRINEPIIDIGSTVSNLVIEAAVRMGAKRIEMVGMDLAFPGDMQYAGDNSKHSKSAYQEYLSVKSVDGQTVQTVDTFNIFRADIEKQICRNLDIEFENLSTKGALINGSYNGTWREYCVSKLLTDRSILSDKNYQALVYIGSMISSIEEGYKTHRDILQKVMFDEIIDAAEKNEIMHVLNKWRENAKAMNDTATIIYLDTIILTIAYDNSVATELINLIDSAQIDYKCRYFWYCQLKYKLEKGGISDSGLIADFLNILKKSITDDVSNQVSIVKNDKVIDNPKNNLCCVIVDQLNQDDIVNEVEALSVAEEAIERGMQVLLINTSEKYPFGLFMPVYSETLRMNNDDFVVEDRICYKSKIIPYFQCESCMPDIGNIKLLLEYIQKSNPSEVISFTEDSVLVWVMEKLLQK